MYGCGGGADGDGTVGSGGGGGGIAGCENNIETVVDNDVMGMDKCWCCGGGRCGGGCLKGLCPSGGGLGGPESVNGCGLLGPMCCDGGVTGMSTRCW